MLQLIRQSAFIEGRWRNGMGVSWEIAAEREPGAVDFSWRLAKARIDGNVPFSIYRGMDRVFMQLAGQGLDLEFEGGRVIPVHESFVPHSFSCDIPLNCKLRSGPCVDLNLFTARDKFRSEVNVVQLNGEQEIVLAGAHTLFFALDGACMIVADGETFALSAGDAAEARDATRVEAQGVKAKLFVGRLMPV